MASSGTKSIRTGSKEGGEGESPPLLRVWASPAGDVGVVRKRGYMT